MEENKIRNVIAVVAVAGLAASLVLAAGCKSNGSSSGSAPAGGSAVLVDTKFDSGDLGPWKAIGGKWRVQEGRAVTSSADYLWIPLAQRSAVTFAADIEQAPGVPVECIMCLCAPRINEQRLRSGIVLTFWGDANIASVSPEDGHDLYAQPISIGPTDFNNLRLRLAYDPKDRATCVWVGDHEVFRGQIPNGPKEGRFVAFGAGGALKVKRLRVLPGIVPPGDAAPLSAAQAPDGKQTAAPEEIQVKLADGDRYSGRVLSLGADGWGHLAGPHFKSEVVFASAAVADIDFSSARPAREGTKILLTNGDYLSGEIESVSAKRTVIANPDFGKLTIPAAHVAAIRPAGGPAFSVDTAFASGDLGPWKTLGGKWHVEQGRAVTSSADYLWIPLAQRSAVTFAADIQQAPGVQVECIMCLCAPRIDKRLQRSGIVLCFWGDAQIASVSPEDGHELYTQPISVGPADLNKLQLRLAYDPKDCATCVWVGDHEVFRGRIADGPKEGEFVALGAAGALKVKRLRVLPGIVPPENAAPLPAAPAAHKKKRDAPDEIQVTLANGDAVTAKSATYAGGRFTIRTEFGQFEAEPKKIVLILFPRQADAPASDAAKMYFEVRTSEGRLRLHSCVLTDEALTGQSDLLGAVSLKRGILRSIRSPRAPHEEAKELKALFDEILTQQQ